MKRTGTIQQVEREMGLAAEARRQGNEGKARVCARRAAGWAVGECFDEDTSQSAPRSAWSILQAVACDVRQPSSVRLAAEHLTLRINTEHMLPDDADLLADAELLIQHFKSNQ